MGRLRRTAINVLDAVHSVLSREVSSNFLRSSAIVFAPHPDDEVLGCGGTILRKVQSGATVHVVFMTDGAASHRGLKPAAELVAIRRVEALSATKALGLSPDHVTFLDFPDHALDDNRALAIERVKSLMTAHAPEQVFVPHAADRLTDHVETNRIVRQAIASGSRAVVMLEYPVWLWHSKPWTTGRPASGTGRLGDAVDWLGDIFRLSVGCRTRVEVSSMLESKRKALRAHRTQMERVGGSPGWPILADVAQGEFLSCFFSGAERFRASRYRP